MLTRQLQRFLIVGFTTVIIDFAVYRTLLFADSPTAVAKALGFVAGTIFAYFANKVWTFERAKGGRNVFIMFMALYLSTLLINVGINSGVIAVLGEAELALGLGFLAATGTSATLNFVGMRMIVFRTKQRVES
ncbi:MAG: GtrA family protein [Dehalococcoidia bacterium]